MPVTFDPTDPKYGIDLQRPGVVFSLEQDDQFEALRKEASMNSLHDHLGLYREVYAQVEEFLAGRPQGMHVVLDQRAPGQFLPKGAVVLGVITDDRQYVPAYGQLPDLPVAAVRPELHVTVTLDDIELSMLRNRIERGNHPDAVAFHACKAFDRALPRTVGSYATSVVFDAGDLGRCEIKSRDGHRPAPTGIFAVYAAA